MNGVEYQRASTLAKKFKYTSDYIGQLCRGRKVDAQLVGRSWYVNPLSLKTHKESRYTDKNTTNEKTFEYKVEINKSRLDVEPVLKKNAVKAIDDRKHIFAKRVNWKPIKYEHDESELLPKLLSERKRILVDLANNELEVLSDDELEGLNSETELVLEVVNLEKDIERKIPVRVNNDKKATKINAVVPKTPAPKFSEPTIDITKVVLAPRSVKEAQVRDGYQQFWRIFLVAMISLLVFIFILILFGDVDVEATFDSYEISFGLSLENIKSILDKF